ncbi:hypothetical protein ScPMuIL_006128 [Solemya velum]
MAASLFLIIVPNDGTDELQETSDEENSIEDVNDEMGDFLGDVGKGDESTENICSSTPKSDSLTEVNSRSSFDEKKKVVFDISVKEELEVNNCNKSEEGGTEACDEDGANQETDLQEDVRTHTATCSSNCSTPFIDEQPDIPLNETVLNILNAFSINSVVQTISADGKSVNLSFLDGGDHLRCESILQSLAEKGVGTKPGTSISLFPTSLHKCGEEHEELQEKTGTLVSEQKKRSFNDSIKSRMLVEQVVFSVRKNAEFSFDYLLLIVLASLVAAVGLVENSSVILVASMLISPLMGPILAGTFGAVIGNSSLRNLGIKSELIGLGLCVLNGILFGIITGGIGLEGAVWGSTQEWPTYEMKSRGMARSLWVGALVAIPSGAGVALSVLSGYAGSLVGVAISASLLPPAVNAGMLWSYAVLSAISPPSEMLDTQTHDAVITSNSTPDISIGDCPRLLNNEYRHVYSCHMATDTAILGLVSLSLTLLNITFIFIMGVIFLKIKEFNPGKYGSGTSEELDTEFWGKDIKIARDSYKTMKGADSVNLGKTFLKEWQTLNQQDNDGKEQEQVKVLQFRSVLHKLENTPYFQRILKRMNHTRPLSSELESEFMKAEQDLHDINFSQYDNYQTHRPQGLTSFPNVHYTFHGRTDPLLPVIYSPTIFFPRRRSNTVSHKSGSETATLHTVEETGQNTTDMKIKMKSQLYKRRKANRKKLRFKVSKVSEGSFKRKKDEVPISSQAKPLLPFGGTDQPGSD